MAYQLEIILYYLCSKQKPHFVSFVFFQISGTLHFVDNTSRNFVMSIFLVQQENATAYDYYVLNDILTFQQLPQDTCNGFQPVDKQRIYVSQPAAPLPTTTAPQLSGVPHTPSVAPLTTSDDVSRTPVSPAAPSKRDDASSMEVEPVELPEKAQVQDSLLEGVVHKNVVVDSGDSESDKWRMSESGALAAESTGVTPDISPPGQEKENAWKKPSGVYICVGGLGVLAYMIV